MLTTTMSTFASSTVHCARCHNHKFDPVSQAEYYNLQSAFAGVDRADRPYDVDPKVHQARRALTARKKELDGSREALASSLLDPAMQAQVAAWEESLPSASRIWTVLKPATFTTEKGTVLVPQADDSLLATPAASPETDVYTVTAKTDLRDVTAIRVDVLTDDSLPAKGPGRAVNGNFHITELRLFASAGGDGKAEQRVELQNGSADFDQQNYASSTAIDGNPQTGWGVDPAEGKPHFAVFETKELKGSDGGTTLKFVIEQQVGRQHTIGRVRLSVTNAKRPIKASPLPPDVAAVVAVPPAERTDAQRVLLALHVMKLRIDEQLAALPTPSRVYIATTDFEPAGNFTPARGCRPVFVLKRGDVTQPGAAAVPGGLVVRAGAGGDVQPHGPERRSRAPRGPGEVAERPEKTC